MVWELEMRVVGVAEVLERKTKSVVMQFVNV